MKKVKSKSVPQALMRRAEKRIPAGVNSPVRAFKAVGGHPVFIQKAQGPYLWDIRGKRYLDFCASWGPMIFGHTPKPLIRHLQKEIQKGTSYGAATEKEVQLAEMIYSFFPSMEKNRLVNSGTEAVMSAIRLARGFTGRNKILKIDGGYHGHVDSLLVKAGSGAATFGTPDSAGIPKELARQTLSIPFNDIHALEKVFKREGKNIAAFILEPVPANMGVILPRPGYLPLARLLTKKYGALLVFDEVITGFRISSGGAQKYFGVQPDLTCLGKILGGGFPLAAYGGRERIMNYISPLGPVYQAGTLSGNPVAVSAALWMLKEFRKKKNIVEKLNEKSETFLIELAAFLESKKAPVQLSFLGSMFTLFFTRHLVTDYASAKSSDTRKFAKYFHRALRKGLYLAPSQFEANFISTAHQPQHFKQLTAFIQSATL